jgi:hypothetical protein
VSLILSLHSRSGSFCQSLDGHDGSNGFIQQNQLALMFHDWLLRRASVHMDTGGTNMVDFKSLFDVNHLSV